MAVAATTQPLLTFTLPSGHDLEGLRRGIAETDLLHICREMNSGSALVLMLAGIVFLLWGFYAFKALVTLNAILIGAWIGSMIGQRTGGPLPAALIGAFTAATITWPLMKYAIAVMGGLIGTLIGMSLWRACGLDPAFAASGGGMGLIFFGMLSFILFRTSIIMFTSVQGAVMLIVGILSIVYKFNGIDTHAIDTRLLVSPMIMPAVVAIAAVIGLIYQNLNGAAPAAGAPEAKAK